MKKKNVTMVNALVDILQHTSHNVFAYQDQYLQYSMSVLVKVFHSQSLLINHSVAVPRYFIKPVFAKKYIMTDTKVEI